ncbi:hypothetical protein L1887_62311 [Cichorium endivia]|nr:hypothetical protein L1887_62311 [Cichorium endivia]
MLKGYTPAAAYAQSKLANVLFSKELAERLADSKVNVFTVRANKCHTPLKRHFRVLGILFVVGASANVSLVLRVLHAASDVRHPVRQSGAQSEGQNEVRHLHQQL